METVQTPAYALIIALLHMTIPLLIGIFCRKLLKPIWNKLLVMVSNGMYVCMFVMVVMVKHVHWRMQRISLVLDGSK